jgi:hypothetical protein
VRGPEVIHSNTPTVPYQIAIRTSRPAQAVLEQLDVAQVPGMAVAERGSHYLVLRSERRFRYGADIAAGLAVAVVLGLLILTAVTPVVLVALPLAFAPAIPLFLDHRPDLAVSAIEDVGITRVTAHGQASAELAEYLDRYLNALPAEDQPDGDSPPEGDGGDVYEDPYDYVYEYDEPPPPPAPETDEGWAG